MRVLVFTSLFPNKLQPLHGIFIYQRVAHFARRAGNAVEVVAPIPYFPAWVPWVRWHAVSQIPRQEQIGGLTVYHPRYLLLPRISMPLHGASMAVGSFLQLFRLIRRSKWDAIDAHYVYPDGFAAVFLGILLRIPVIVSARGTDINLFPQFRLIRKMISWTLRHARGVIAVSTALKEAMVALGGRTERIRVISNGVDFERFSPIDRRMARQHEGLPEDGPMIVSVGALIPTKGHQFVFDAVAEIAARFPGLRLYVVGDGPFRRKLETLVSESGLEGRVFLVGSKPNDELKFWYSAADVMCLASMREGQPNVLLESLACGTPVVATRVGGVAEIIVSPELGIVSELDSHKLARDLELALKKSWNREALAHYGRARGWAKVADEVERWFAECV